MDRYEKQFKLLQKIIDSCINHDYNVVENLFFMRKKYLNKEQLVDYVRKEIFRITEELMGINQQYRALQEIAFKWHIPNFIWETSFYEKLWPEECMKFLNFSYEEFDIKAYIKNPTSYDEVLPFFSKIIRMIVYSKHLKDLQEIENELLQTPATKESILKPEDKTNTKNIVGKDNPFNCKFNDIEISLLTDCVNEAKIFTTEITSQILEDFFYCRLNGLVKSKNNQVFSYFMGQLKMNI